MQRENKIFAMQRELDDEMTEGENIDFAPIDAFLPSFLLALVENRCYLENLMHSCMHDRDVTGIKSPRYYSQIKPWSNLL